MQKFISTVSQSCSARYNWCIVSINSKFHHWKCNCQKPQKQHCQKSIKTNNLYSLVIRSTTQALSILWKINATNGRCVCLEFSRFSFPGITSKLHTLSSTVKIMQVKRLELQPSLFAEFNFLNFTSEKMHTSKSKSKKLSTWKLYDSNWVTNDLTGSTTA